ncbi:doxX [alpha proteobacterium U9-1i]|nr:doxX [alpha proteobacterium U9-1i]
MMRLARIGAIVLALAFIAIGAASALFTAALPGLDALSIEAPAWPSQAAGAVLMVAGAAMLVPPLARIGAWLGVVYWLPFTALTTLAALSGPFDLTAWVPVAEAAAFAAACYARAGAPAGALILRLAFGVMLIWFGVVHLMHRDIIASLIPAWIPYAEHWPWLTGGVNLLAGLALIANRYAATAALAIAAMFGSWLPLVHAERLLSAPDSLFEWTFALTAIGLAGAALLIAGERQTPPPSTL